VRRGFLLGKREENACGKGRAEKKNAVEEGVKGLFAVGISQKQKKGIG